MNDNANRKKMCWVIKTTVYLEYVFQYFVKNYVKKELLVGNMPSHNWF